MIQLVWGVLHSSTCRVEVRDQEQTLCQNPRGRIRLSVADGLGDSLEAQNKPEVA